MPLRSPIIIRAAEKGTGFFLTKDELDLIKKLRQAGILDIEKSIYVSSSEYSVEEVWYQNGHQFPGEKGFNNRVRAIRAFCPEDEIKSDRASERGPDEPYQIGDRGPGGGWVFYDKGNHEGGWRYLEAAYENQGRAAWGCLKKSIPDARRIEVGTGKSNTEAILKACTEKNIAAKVASSYRGGGKSDWFLPSREELNLLYRNLRQRGIGDFANYAYWSSSESKSETAWDKGFNYGTQFGIAKYETLWVLPIRAF